MAKRESNVDRVYDDLRRMAANFAFKPDQRINESELAARLGASRTPVREALNRLVAEGFLTFQSGRGFFCRSLSPQHILDLYQARVAIECEALRLACAGADSGDITALARFLDDSETAYVNGEAIDVLAIDEDFHLRLCALSGNAELTRLLRNLNDRIRYVRLIDLRRKRAAETRPAGHRAHRDILAALAVRDAARADAALRGHIERRREQATEAVRIAFSQLYVPQE